MTSWFTLIKSAICCLRSLSPHIPGCSSHSTADVTNYQLFVEIKSIRAWNMKDGVKSANCCFASSSGQGFFFSSLARIAVVHPLACQKEGCYSPVVCPVISRSDLCLKIPLQTNKLQSWRLWEIWLFFSFRVLIEAAVASDGEQDNFRSWQVFICFLNGVISHSVVPHGRLTAASSESWSRPAASLSGREIISVESTVVGGLLPSLYCH